jgi:two-component system response regulator LytT
MATTPPITALIVDDEPLARQELQFLLESAGGVEIVAQGGNGIEAVELIRTHKPDVLFLDVQMPALDGFAVLKKVLTLDRRAKLPEVVFATAFDQYAVRAFEVNAVDYLLKPFDEKRLRSTIEKLRTRIAARAEAAPSSPTEAKLDELLRMIEERTPATNARSGKVVVRAGGRLLLTDQKDVCFAAIEDGTITVVTRQVEGDSNCRTLEELGEQLDPEQFWRVHRSYLVNIQHIREVVPWFKSSFQLRMDDRKATGIPVARAQTKRLKELFNL